MNAKRPPRTAAILAALLPLCLAAGCQSEEETTADPFTESPPDIAIGAGGAPDTSASPDHGTPGDGTPGGGAPGHAAAHRPGGGIGVAQHDAPKPHEAVRPHDPVITQPDAPRPTDAPLIKPAPIAPAPPAKTETAGVDPPRDPATPLANPAARETTHDPSASKPRAVSLPETGAGDTAPRTGPRSIALTSRTSAAKPRTDRPPVIRLPLGLTRDKPADNDKAAPREAHDAAKLPALPLPPPSDRLTALDRVRASEYEDFVFRFDGEAPRLLTRAEAITALRSDQKASVVVLPLTAEDASILGRWIQRGRTMKAPQPWMTQLEQSTASRKRQNDRREAELDRVRRQRQVLRDSMYRLLLGDKKPPPK